MNAWIILGQKDGVVNRIHAFLSEKEGKAKFNSYRTLSPDTYRDDISDSENIYYGGEKGTGVETAEELFSLHHIHLNDGWMDEIRRQVKYRLVQKEELFGEAADMDRYQTLVIEYRDGVMTKMTYDDVMCQDMDGFDPDDNTFYLDQNEYNYSWRAWILNADVCEYPTQEQTRKAEWLSVDPLFEKLKNENERGN